MALPSFDNLLLASQRKRRDSIVDEMDLTNLLNTNRSASALGHRNMQYEASIPMNMHHDMSAGHYGSQNLYVPNANSRIKSENGSERAISPHNSEQSSRYSSQTPQQNNMSYLANQLTSIPRYPSPSMQQQSNMPMIQHSYHPNAGVDQSYQQQAQMGAVQTPTQQDQSNTDGSRPSGSGLPKAFACSTCAKGFARRSDLARHERIHSGVRPHVCEHPNCGKQFIQRSALTVHTRVHTGEKPHMCERCGKPFSDSSSLARHRRIHSGKRPYKCPYADCQKTFTRRTTLTRHQNHHTGTIEESEAATAAALASRVSMASGRSRGSDEEGDYSDGKSPLPQQSDRPSSVAPSVNMAGIPSMSRQSSDLYLQAMSGQGLATGIPVAAQFQQHLRNEMQGSPRPQSPAQYPMPPNTGASRPSLTSQPSSGYNPPQILEPPTTNGHQNGSGNNSPHMNHNMGWQSPHNGMTSNQHNDYSYPDPNNQYGQANAAMYYQQPVQRPHSTGPMDYQQMRAPEMWAQHQQ